MLSGLYDEDADTYDGHVEAVGFTAWTQSTQLYSPGDTIIFEGTEVNEGTHTYIQYQTQRTKCL